MTHDEASLMKLNKEELVRITLDYQEKFNGVLGDLKKDVSNLKIHISGLKSDCSKLEKRKYETICKTREQILGIPASVVDHGHESHTLEILEEIVVAVDTSLVEYCHCLSYKGSPKRVAIKLNRRKDITRVLLNESKLKNLKPESVNLSEETKFSLMRVCA